VDTLERDSAAEALAAFEATLKKEPHRFNATAGAAAAAVKLGDTAKAKAYYESLIALAAGPYVDRPELVAARAFVASH
jgi:Tfp pilus assembly protein PilF